MSLLRMQKSSHHESDADNGQFPALSEMLNAAAFSLQKAMRSEKAIFQLFAEEVGKLRLRGGIFLVDKTRTKLVLKTMAFSSGSITSLLNKLLKKTGLSVEGYSFDIDSVDTCREVLTQEHTVSLLDSSEILHQIIPDSIRPYLDLLIDTLGKSFAVLVPLHIDGRANGILSLSGSNLQVGDIPAIETFANHLAVVLENAQLFRVMQDAYGQMKESEAKYRNVVEHSNDGICIVQDGIIRYANEQLCRLLAISASTLKNSPFGNLVERNGRQLILDQFENLLAGKEHEPRFDALVLAASNRTVTTEITISATTLDSKPAILVFVRDITHANKVDQEIQKIEKLESLGILAGGIAHDFNNILTAILSSISLSRQLIPRGEDCVDLLAEAEIAAMRARDLTQQLLTFSKGGEPVKRTVDIKNLISDATRFALRGSNVSCKFNICLDLWTVNVDAGQISQVMHNLVINASQAMSEGGTITVTASNVTVPSHEIVGLREGKYVRITVQDTGSGIPQAYLSRVFDPFFTTKPTGSGLGLATTYSIIKKHDGTISLDSKLAAGTTATFYLPVSRVQSPPATNVSPEIIRGTGRVLVMDDEEIVRKSAGQLLKFIGYDADFASSGHDAIDLYKKARAEGKPFHAVIMDLTVPGGLGGKETIKRLLEIDPDVKAIVSSGYSNDPIVAAFSKYGFKAVLAKPYSVQELGTLLRKVLLSQEHLQQ